MLTPQKRAQQIKEAREKLPLDQRQVEALESIADSLVKIHAAMVVSQAQALQMGSNTPQK